MVATLEQVTPGQLIHDPTKTIKVLQHVISWVDDTVNKELLNHHLDTKTQLQRIRDILIHWRKIIRITGGDIELNKTVVYLLDYVFSDGGTIPHFCPKEYIQGDIRLPVEIEGDTNEPIKRNDYAKAEKYLGVRLAPNGQMDKWTNGDRV